MTTTDSAASALISSSVRQKTNLKNKTKKHKDTMKTTTKEYLTPQIEVCQLLIEGAVLSASTVFPGGNESYGGLDDEEIF